MVLEPVSETTYISNTLTAYSNNFIFFFFSNNFKRWKAGGEGDNRG